MGETKRAPIQRFVAALLTSLRSGRRIGSEIEEMGRGLSIDERRLALLVVRRRMERELRC